VQGHLGDPGTELVDTLASDAITNAALTPCHDWLQQHTRGTFANLSAWFWMLFAVEYNGLWNGPCIEFPQPVTQPDTAVIEGLPSVASYAAETIETVHIHVRCATCNVLSLCGSRSSEVGEVVGPARLAIILRQMKEEKIMQETRLRKLHHKHDADYFLFRSAATQQGHSEMMVGFARTLPYASSPCGQQKVYFQDQDFPIVYADPRALIIRLASDCLRALIVAAHAPHSGNSDEQLAECMVGATFTSHPCCLSRLDCHNVGHDLSVHIGNPHAGADGTKADHFADFIRKHEIWLPATFDAFHTGPGETWFHPNGHVDAYPMWAYLEHGRSPNVRPGLVIRLILQSPKLTTFRLVLKYAFRFPAPRRSPVSRPQGVPKLRMPSTANLDDLVSLPYQCRPISPEVDVHTHAGHLNTQLYEVLRREQPHREKRPLKTTLTADTRDLICQKRECRSHLANLVRMQKLPIRS